MASCRLVILATLAIAAVHGAPRQQISNSTARAIQPLYSAIFYSDGRPAKVLIDNIGSSESPKIQTGEPVEDSYPFIGAIGAMKKQKAEGGGTQFSYVIVCTSSLISKRHILAAAHCVQPIDDMAADGYERTYVHSVSDIRIQNVIQSDPSRYIAIVDKYIMYPEADGGIKNDVAVGILKEDLDAQSTTPICLRADSQISKDIPVTAAGWGMKNCEEASHEVLRRANGQLVPKDQCQKYYGEMNDNEICALFELDDGTPAAVAPGDSGGPLFFEENNGQVVQVGVASYVAQDQNPHDIGHEDEPFCTDKTVPQVYARVASFKSFIDKHTDASWC